MWLVCVFHLTLLLNGGMLSAAAEDRTPRRVDIEPVEPNREMEQLSRRNFLVGIASVGARLANGTQCGHELEKLLKAIEMRDFWSMKVIDSYGSAPKTFSWGNYFWFAAKELCDDLNEPYRISFSSQHDSHQLFNFTAAFPLRFSMVYFKFQTPHYIDIKLPFENLIHVGLCLPHSCHSSDIFRYSDEYFKRNVFEMQRTFNLQMQAVDIRAPQFGWSFFRQTGSVAIISILLLLTSLNIIAVLVNKSKVKLKMQQKLQQKSNTTAADPVTGLVMVPITPTQFTHNSSSEELLQCFRWSENYERLVHLEESNNFLSVIAGLRTIICLWVTVFHVYYYSLFAMSNTPMIFAKLEYFVLQPVLQSCFYVDVFFVISAFLLVYNFLSNENQMRIIRQNSFVSNLKLYLKALLHRYMRLTPVLVITMFLSDMTLDLLNTYSPFRLDVNCGIYCKKNWWYNLLYIQNFQDMKNICLSWTWYLGCEMQYFLLFTALLHVYAKNEKLAKTIFVLMCGGFVLGSFFCNYYNNITFQMDIVYTTLDQLYVKPWVRIVPYIGGAALGWLLHRHKKPLRQCTPWPVSGAVRRHWQSLFWLGFGLLYVVTNFMTYWRSAPMWLVAAIMSFGKFLFALYVGGVIVMCAWGRGGLLNAALSAKPFLFLNKFCYSIYMVAPVIVFALFGLRLEATSFNEVGSGMDFLAVIALSIGTAMVIVLLVELPMQRIASHFLRKR